MDQAVGGNNSHVSTVLPVKRRRGRPRKDPNAKCPEIARVPPGFGVSREPQLVQAEQRKDVMDSMVGQTVTGVVEAAFDAGYLLCVRIGNSATNLRGVVLKPGHYAPVTAENDIAPHLPMIQRNEVRFPVENQFRGHGHNQLSERSELRASVVVSRGKHSTVAASVPPVGARGTVVPVVLEPVNSSNGFSPLTGLRDRDVQTVLPLAILPPETSIPTSQGSVTSSKLLPSQPLSKPPGLDQQNGSLNGGSLVNGKGEAGKLVQADEGEDIRRIGNGQQSSESVSQNANPAAKTSAEEQGTGSQIEIRDINEPYLPFSQQVVQCTVQSHSAPVLKPLANYGTGRMTELLLAVQENLAENQMHCNDQAAGSSKVEFHEVKHPAN